jgi:hypothetical protein
VLPILSGRIQTRIFLVLVIGGIWTLVFTPVVRLLMDGDPTMSQAYKLTYTLLILTLVLGIVWEFIYEGLQQFRWEKDWPTLFGWLTAINEGIAVYLVAKALATEPEPGGVEWRELLNGLTLPPFLLLWITTWIVITLFATNLMKILFIRWRFKGGRLIGGW